MKVALFIPCYIDAFFPEVGIAALELLERFDIEVAYPLDQTCCAQPMANSGCHDEAAATEKLFVRNFAGFDYVVGPSGSCVHHIRENLTAIKQTAEVKSTCVPSRCGFITWAFAARPFRATRWPTQMRHGLGRYTPTSRST